MRRGRPAPGVEFSHSLCPRRRLNKRQDNTWGPISSTKFKTVFLSNFQALESRELEHNSPAAFLEEMLWSLHVREAWIFIVGHVDRSVPNRPRLPELAPYAFGALQQPAKCATRGLRLHESVAVAHEVEDGEHEMLRQALGFRGGKTVMSGLYGVSAALQICAHRVTAYGFSTSSTDGKAKGKGLGKLLDFLTVPQVFDVAKEVLADTFYYLFTDPSAVHAGRQLPTTTNGAMRILIATFCTTIFRLSGSLVGSVGHRG